MAGWLAPNRIYPVRFPEVTCSYPPQPGYKLCRGTKNGPPQMRYSSRTRCVAPSCAVCAFSPQGVADAVRAAVADPSADVSIVTTKQARFTHRILEDLGGAPCSPTRLLGWARLMGL